MQRRDVGRMVRSEYQVLTHRKFTGILSPESDPDPAAEEREAVYEFFRAGGCYGQTRRGSYSLEVCRGKVSGCLISFRVRNKEVIAKIRKVG